MRFAFIDAEKASWPVEVQCEVLGVSRSGYYAWKGRPDAPRTREDAEVVVEIKAASEVGRGVTDRPMRSTWWRRKPQKCGPDRPI